MSYIHVEDLTVSYGESPVLWDVDVDIEKTQSLQSLDQMVQGSQRC